jgi:pseudaminic acid cytidylyltransferase
MKMENNIICIIPARSSSKRIKNKNIINFFGKPVISYPIIACKKSKIFNKILVSTDSKKISKISKKYGAETPLLRDKIFANDYATTSVVLYNEIKKFNTISFKYHCCIYPCNPLIDFKILKKAFIYFKKNNFDSLFSVIKYPHSILRSFRIDKKNIYYKYPSNMNKRSQDLKQFVYDAGCFYFFKTKQFLKTRRLYSKNTGFYILPKYSHVDIDTNKDLNFAKEIYKIRKL